MGKSFYFHAATAKQLTGKMGPREQNVFTLHTNKWLITPYVERAKGLPARTRLPILARQLNNRQGLLSTFFSKIRLQRRKFPELLHQQKSIPFLLPGSQEPPKLKCLDVGGIAGRLPRAYLLV
jgi:hypothetical protein